MSIWQNFKETDHSFEKKFFGAIFLMALCIAGLVLIGNLFDQIPDVKKLFVSNRKGLIAFLVLFIIVFFGTFWPYARTLDFIEAETKETIKVVKINVVAWIVFWAAWSIYWALITVNVTPMTLHIKLIIVLLVTAPGLISFFISRSVRLQAIKDEEDDKRKMGDKYEPYTLCLDRKYYSGYYALFCLPVYLLAVLVGYLLSN
jgi:hypothetical protein